MELERAVSNTSSSPIGVRRCQTATASSANTANVAVHFLAKYYIPPEQVTSHSGLTLLAGMTNWFSRPLEMADAYMCLFAVGMVLAIIGALLTAGVSAILFAPLFAPILARWQLTRWIGIFALASSDVLLRRSAGRTGKS